MAREMSDPALTAFVKDRDDLIVVACSVVGNVHVAEDLVQDCWLRWSQREYPAHQARPILMRIVKNLAIDWHRRRRLEFGALEAHRLLQDAPPDAERVVNGRQRLAVVVRALQELPARTLFAFRCARVENLTLKETGKRLGVSESRASQLVADAIVHISGALDRLDR
ncbi:MAG: sigma-70 family RNA polymerase sigma factor [Pseudomonadota bacterium]